MVLLQFIPFKKRKREERFRVQAFDHLMNAGPPASQARQRRPRPLGPRQPGSEQNPSGCLLGWPGKGPPRRRRAPPPFDLPRDHGPGPQVRGFHTADPPGRGEQVRNRGGVTNLRKGWRPPPSPPRSLAGSTRLGSHCWGSRRDAGTTGRGLGGRACLERWRFPLLPEQTCTTPQPGAAHGEWTPGPPKYREGSGARPAVGSFPLAEPGSAHRVPSRLAGHGAHRGVTSNVRRCVSLGLREQKQCA